MITERTVVFQGLRLIGIVTIVAAHAGLSLVGGGNWCTFFFVLSGFLFHDSIGTVQEYGQYLWRKASRLYPIYWFCLALYLLLAVVRGCEQQYTLHWDFIAHFLLIQTWLPGIDPMAYLAVAWFLSALLFCYLVAPLIYKIVDKSKYAILLFISVIITFYAFNANGYLSPLFRLCEYAIGMWLFRWLCKGKKQRKEPFAGLILLAVLSLLALLRYGVPIWSNIPLFALLIYGVYMFQSDILRSILGNRFIVWLSKSDMVIYLTHAGIGFHLVYYFLSFHAAIATLGSIVIGVVIRLSFEWIQRMMEKCILSLQPQEYKNHQEK